jgi:iron complex transport system ATP-binding protein
VSPGEFLDIRALSFSYDKKKAAVRDFSLTVPARAHNGGDGIFLSVIGPNGSGKTTLIKMLAGILLPGSGSVRILGTRITRRTDPSKILAYVPQRLSLGFSLPVLDFVLLGVSSGGAAGRVSRAAVEKARRALWLLGIEDFGDRDMLRLSGGERQKVILSKALAQETPVILLDEPTTHLDLAGQIEILDLLRRMTLREGKKVAAIMHDVNLAARYSDYTIMMKEGRLFGAGETSGVISEEAIRRCFSVAVEKVGDFFIPVKTEGG